MRLNVKVADTGVESDDWDHIEGVDDVDVRDEILRWQRDAGEGDTYKLDDVMYFHVTEE